MSNWVCQRRGTKHMLIETWLLLRNILLVSKIMIFSLKFLYKIYQSNTISMLRYSIMLNNMITKIWNMVSHGETLSWVRLSRWLYNCSGIGSQSMYDVHWSITQDHLDPDFKPIQWPWLSLESGLHTKPDSVGSLNPPIMPEYMASTLAHGVRAIKGFLDLRKPNAWFPDERFSLVLGQTEAVVRSVVRPVLQGRPVWRDDSGRSRIDGKLPFSWGLNVQRCSPPLVTARAMSPVVAAWNEAVRLSMVEHRERVRALSVWHSFRALGHSERGPSSAPLAKLSRRGSVGMKLKGKCDSDPNLNFLDELEEDKWLKHIGESMESGSSLLLTQRNVYSHIHRIV